MPSKVKILPSDVLILIIDYLDSPTMMNCREVCKSWLEIVDSSASLWTYFYDTSLTDIVTTSNMLKLFSIKSHDNLKAFSVIQGGRERRDVSESIRSGTSHIHELLAEWQRRQEASTIVRILLRSKESLRLFDYSGCSYNLALANNTFGSSAHFPNLKSSSIQGAQDQKAKVTMRQSRVVDDLLQPNTAGRTSLTELLIQDPSGRVASQLATLIKSSQSTLLHLQIKIKELEYEKLSFTRLQVLQIPSYRIGFPSDWHCPSLRVLILSLLHTAEKSVVDYFSPSVEHLWLRKAEKDHSLSIRRGDLDSLRKGNPSLEILRIDLDVEFYSDEIVEMVQARIAAVKEGLEVEGSEMRSMKNLILDFSKLDSPTLSKLQELVPEVVDVRTASDEIIIDC